MKAHGLPRIRHWILLVLVGGIGLVVHSIILYRALTHTAVSVGVVSGAIVLILLKHLGVFGPLYTLFRRRSLL